MLAMQGFACFCSLVRLLVHVCDDCRSECVRTNLLDPVAVGGSGERTTIGRCANGRSAAGLLLLERRANEPEATFRGIVAQNILRAECYECCWLIYFWVILGP